MVIFEKNGQGCFDFDFELLVELTNIEFANTVKREILRKEETLEDVMDVVFEQNKYFILVHVFTNYGVSVIRYDKEMQDTDTRFMTFGMMDTILKHAQKIGVRYV